jgi:hypothetical protein
VMSPTPDSKCATAEMISHMVGLSPLLHFTISMFGSGQV